jgi:hypothetical protein
MALAPITAAYGSGEPPAVAAGKPIVKSWDEFSPCHWWMDADDGTNGGSISPGNEGMQFSITDAAFLEWSNSGEHAIELSFDGDPGPRVKGQAWVTHIADTTASAISLELDVAGIAKLAGATSVTLFRNNAAVVTKELAGTPDFAKLEACMPVPGEHGDAES